MKVRKTTFEDDLAQKEAYFLSLQPIQRLEMAEQLKRKIFFDKSFKPRTEKLTVTIHRGK